MNNLDLPNNGCSIGRHKEFAKMVDNQLVAAYIATYEQRREAMGARRAYHSAQSLFVRDQRALIQPVYYAALHPPDQKDATYTINKCSGSAF